ARKNLVPPDPTIKEDVARDGLVLPQDDPPWARLKGSDDGIGKPKMTITNIPLRGLWSVIVIVLIISITIIFALLEWWETILYYLSFLDIRINAAGYFVISSILFALWLIVMLLFDRQIYMVFTPGQMRVRQEVGDAETAYDTSGMTVQKQRSDLFRHWVLGLGSGDLIVKTSGATSQEFHFPNVLFIGRKVKDIEDMLREKQVVTGPKP